MRNSLICSGLSFLDKKKVELVNQLYAQVTRISIACISLGILVVIKNPAPLLADDFLHGVESFLQWPQSGFHSCCHGG